MSDQVYFDKINESTNRINKVAYSLLKLSQAFGTTGNADLHNTLWFYCQELTESGQNIHQATGGIVSEMVKTAGRNSANVLGAVLAGITLEKKSKKQPSTTSRTPRGQRRQR